MRPLVLALALAALLSPAAPAPRSPEPFEKKLAEAVKEAFETDAKIQTTDDVEQSNTINDVDNKLKKTPEDIPVKVVVEDVKPDLKHPGEPQRQEHETQNPEHHEDQESALAALKQMVADTQGVFNSGFKQVGEHIAEWLTDNKPEISIKDSIDNLQETFMENIDKLNATIQSYWNHGIDIDVDKQVEIKKVQSGLKDLEEKFESGVQNLNNGVKTLAVLKTGRDDATTTTAKPSNPFTFVTNMWQTVTNQFGNMTNTLQNIIGQNSNSTQAAASAQSDDPSGTTARPGVWQNIQNQFQGIFQNRPGQPGVQSDEQPAQNGPFAQVIQNVPLLQNFVNFIQPKPPGAEPAKPSEGSNVVPAEPQAASDAQQQKKPDEPAQPAQPQRPIQQIIQKNPIVQSITGAVQKIQHSITNPERPREEEPEKVEAEKDAPEKDSAVKAGFFPYPGHGHHGHRPADGDNNDSGIGLKSAPADAEKTAPVEAEKKSPVEPEKKAPVEPEKKSPVEPEKKAPVESEKKAPVESEKPAEAVKSAPVEPQSAPVKKIAVEPAKIVVDDEQSAVIEAVKSAPVEPAPVKEPVKKD